VEQPRRELPLLTNNIKKQHIIPDITPNNTSTLSGFSRMNPIILDEVKTKQEPQSPKPSPNIKDDDIVGEETLEG
jgi:hypothetical protein